MAQEGLTPRAAGRGASGRSRLLALLAPLALGTAGCGGGEATVLYVTDAHEIAPVRDRHGERGGVARLKTAVDRVRRERPGALLVFGGDLAGGTLFGVFRGEPMVDALGRAGVGLATFGQHDFDFGAAHARALVARAAFPYLTSNLVDAKGAPFAGLPTRRLVTLSGLRVGFLGLTDALETTAQEGTVVQADLVASARREASALRRDGAEAIVALTQADREVNERLLREVALLDAVLTEEESETLSTVRFVSGRPIAAPCGNIGSVVELALSGRRGAICASVTAHPVDATVSPDADLAAEERRWMAVLEEKLSAPIGRLAGTLEADGSRERETPLGRLVADAYREATRADAALVAGSSLRADLPAGALVKRHAVAVLPFGNRVVLLELTGAALRATLERGLGVSHRSSISLLQVSGLTYLADLAAPAGKRLLDAKVSGAPLRDGGLYRVATSSHLASGGDGFAELASARRLDVAGGAPVDADAFAAHISRLAAQGPVSPPEAGRILLRSPG